MADQTQIDAWGNEALALAGDERAAEALVRRIYEAGLAAAHGRESETVEALQRELAKLRRTGVSAGS